MTIGGRLETEGLVTFDSDGRYVFHDQNFPNRADIKQIDLRIETLREARANSGLKRGSATSSLKASEDVPPSTTPLMFNRDPVDVVRMAEQWLSNPYRMKLEGFAQKDLGGR